MARRLWVAALLALLTAAPGLAGAAPTLELIWTSTTGSGTAGASSIEAQNGDVLTADVVLTVDVEGVAGYSVSLEFDQALDDELDLLSATGVLNPEWPSPLPGNPISTLESSISVAGNVLSYGAFCPGPPCFQLPGPYVIGTVTFQVKNVSTDGDDVFTGLFNQPGMVDEILAGDGFSFLGFATTFLGAAVDVAQLTPGPVPFAGAQSLSASGDRAVLPADVDGDGDLDVVLADATLNAVRWAENLAGDSSSWATRTIATSVVAPQSVDAADFDGDGDLDVLAASFSDNTVAWFENDGTPAVGAWTEHVIVNTALGPRAAVAADVDGDGDLDVMGVSQNDDGVMWAENDGTPGGLGDWAFHVIAAPAAVDGPFSITAADVDGDGDLDAVTTSILDDEINWFENDGTPAVGSWTAHSVSTAAVSPLHVIARDVDGDGDLDLLSASSIDDTIAWYENDGTPAVGAWTRRAITTGADGAFAVAAEDVDADGDLDVLSASANDSRLAWYVNQGGSPPTWAEFEISSTTSSATAVAAADLDGDGDLDILGGGAGGGGQVTWHENRTIHRSATFPVTAQFGTGSSAIHVFPADLDRDGDLDMVTSALFANTVAWQENTAGDGSSWTPHTITTLTNGPNCTAAGDLDGDGDPDVVSASRFDDELAWYENRLDELSADLGPQQVFSTSQDQVGWVVLADVDRNGTLDVVAASQTDNTVAWYANDGSGGFGTAQVITTTANSVDEIFAADVDGDGDADVVSANDGSGTVVWYENAVPTPTWSAHTVGTGLNRPTSVFAADLDADGDLDVLAASADDDTVAWYENTDGAGAFGPQQVISTAGDGPLSVHAADLDLDGDLDVVAVSWADDEVAWYENTNGAGSFGAQQILSTSADNPQWVGAADVDGDGDPDVLAAAVSAGLFNWYENRGGQFSLPTTASGKTGVLESDIGDVLRFDLVHQGRTGDADLELATVDLLFEDEFGAQLADTQLNALVLAALVLVDDGDGVFDGGDLAVATATGPFSLFDSGNLVLTVPDGDPGAQVGQGAPRKYYVALIMQPTASSATPNRFQVVHLTESSSTAEDRDADLALALEFHTDTLSGVLQALDPALDEDGDGLTNQDEVNLWGSDPIDQDTDGDGLLDGDEVNVHGSSPTLVDTDGDGLDDGVEVAQGSDPADPDSDDDDVCDGGTTVPPFCETSGPDNCPLVPNLGQTNSDALPAGDSCQCGDVNNDGVVDAVDLQIAAEKLVGRTLSGSFVQNRCNVIGPQLGGGEDCDVRDLYVLERHVGGQAVTVENACTAYTGPF